MSDLATKEGRRAFMAAIEARQIEPSAREAWGIARHRDINAITAEYHTYTPVK